MDTHEFEHDGARFEVRFERVAEGWLGHIHREGEDITHVMAFPDGVGYDAGDVRGSLIAGCEAAVANLAQAPATRH